MSVNRAPRLWATLHLDREALGHIIDCISDGGEHGHPPDGLLPYLEAKMDRLKTLEEKDRARAANRAAAADAVSVPGVRAEQE